MATFSVRDKTWAILTLEMFPGSSDIAAMPSSPYFFTNSFANRTLP